MPAYEALQDQKIKETRKKRVNGREMREEQKYPCYYTA
jgi:hypothetical protein